MEAKSVPILFIIAQIAIVAASGIALGIAVSSLAAVGLQKEVNAQERTILTMNETLLEVVKEQARLSEKVANIHDALFTPARAPEPETEPTEEGEEK